MRTVSLKTARKLKDAGFEQSSAKIYYHWVQFKKEYTEPNYKTKPWHKPCLWPNASEPDHVIASAPSTDELLEELPWRIKSDQLGIDKGPAHYDIYYGKQWYAEHEALPEALAEMWLSLKSKGLLTPSVEERDGK